MVNSKSEWSQLWGDVVLFPKYKNAVHVGPVRFLVKCYTRPASSLELGVATGLRALDHSLGSFLFSSEVTVFFQTRKFTAINVVRLFCSYHA